MRQQTSTKPEIPEDWDAAILNELADIKGRIGWRGLKASEYTKNGPFLIANKHIIDYKIRWELCDHLSEFRYDESPEIQLDTHDVVLSKDGTIGQVAFIDHLPGKTTLNSTMMLLRVRDKRLNPKFLYYFLQGPHFKRFIYQKVSGTSIPHIFQRDMKNLNILFPSEVEQQKITDVLTIVDTTIQKSNDIISKTKRLKQGLMQELFKNTKWRFESLSNEKIFKLIMGQSPPSITYNLNKEGLPFYQGNADFGELHPKPRIYCNSPIKIAEKGDILISVRAPVGELNIVDQKCCIGRGLAAIRILEKENLFYFYFLKYIKNKIQAFSQGSTFKAITATEFKRIKVPIPDIKEQQKIVGILSTVDKKLEMERKRKEIFETIKKGLLNELLTGKKRVKIVG